MKKQTLFTLWGVLYVLCAALGFVQRPGTALGVLMSVLSVAFFVPGGMLLYSADQKADRHTVLLVRNLAIASLLLTAILIVANILSAFTTPAVGNMLYIVLIVVSSPMVCSRFWALSLFLWACLLFGSLRILKHRK